MNDDKLAPGWFDTANQATLYDLIREYKIKTVAEVGTFLGRSALWFATDPLVEHVWCIDTWFEGANYESENNLVGTLRRWDLPRDFFHIFRDNVMRSGVWHKITPVRGNSHYVAGEVPVCDLVYLDGSHRWEDVKQDIRIYRDKARVCLCGDDYVERKDIDGSECFGVIQAVNELLPDAQHVGPFWYWRRP